MIWIKVNNNMKSIPSTYGYGEKDNMVDNDVPLAGDLKYKENYICKYSRHLQTFYPKLYYVGILSNFIAGS